MVELIDIDVERLIQAIRLVGRQGDESRKTMRYDMISSNSGQHGQPMRGWRYFRKDFLQKTR